MKYINEQESSQLITHALAYDAVSSAFIAVSEQAKVFPVVIAEGVQDKAIFSIKSACSQKLNGWKVGSYWPQNIALGLPCHGSTIFLLHPKTGFLDAVIESSMVNAYRTAAADAVAVDKLARKDASSLTIFGTGHQAFYECIAVSKIRAIKQVFVVGRNKEKAIKLSQKLSIHGLNAKVEEAKKACEQADIIITATTAKVPLFDHSWIKAGTHISAMGADTHGKQELSIELFKNAKLFCDFDIQAIDIGEFQHVNKTEQDRITIIGKVISGESMGRECESDITIFDSSGIALQDLFIGNALLEKSANAHIK